MSKPSKPAWPSPGAFPFMSFPIPGFAPPAAPAAAPPSGLDLLGSVWGSLPGTSQIPGFLVPTVDVDELDKRIADLKAAQAWVEVNLNLLRATIQGLEVQRHTIAALRSFSTMPEPSSPPKPSPVASPPAARSVPEPPPPAPAPVDQAATPATPPTAPQPGIAAGQWLGYLQDQFAKVAEAALGATSAGGSPTPAAKRAPAAAEKRVRKAVAPRKRPPAGR